MDVGFSSDIHEHYVSGIGNSNSETRNRKSGIAIVLIKSVVKGVEYFNLFFGTLVQHSTDIAEYARQPPFELFLVHGHSEINDIVLFVVHFLE